MTDFENRIGDLENKIELMTESFDVMAARDIAHRYVIEALLMTQFAFGPDIQAALTSLLRGAVEGTGAQAQMSEIAAVRWSEIRIRTRQEMQIILERTEALLKRGSLVPGPQS